MIESVQASDAKMSQGYHNKLKGTTQKIQQKIGQTTKIKDLIDSNRELSSIILEIDTFVVSKIIKSPDFTNIENNVIPEEQKLEIDD